MVSERMQGRIDRLLDRADAAADTGSWDDAGVAVRAILAIQSDHEDALGLMKMVDAALSDGEREKASDPPPAATSSSPTPPTPHLS